MVTRDTAALYPRKNYILNTVDGLFASVGQGMVGVNILMLFISEYIDNKTMIGLLVTVNILLMQCGQIFLSGRVQRSSRIKPIVLLMCVVERSLWILLGIGVILLAQSHTGLFLVLFYFMYAVLGLVTAFLYFSWTNYIIRIIHPAARGKFLGTRNAITGVFSMLGALLYGIIVKLWDLPLNYGLLFIIAGAIQMIATPILGATKEPRMEDIQAEPPKRTALRPRVFLDIIKNDKTFAYYLLAMTLVGGIGKMAFSFQVVYAKESLAITGEINSYAMFVMLACQCIGALLCGVLGDRYGFKRLIAGSTALLLPAVMITYFMSGVPMFLLSMGLVGLSQGISGVCSTNMLIELSGKLDNMPVYTGIFSFVLGPVYALNYIVSGFIYDAFGYGYICILSAVSLAVGVWFLYNNLLARKAAA